MAKMHVSSNYISAKLTTPEQALIEAVSPKVDVERKDNGYHVTITDIDGEHEFDLLNGERGLPGLNGLNGKDGETPLVMAVKRGSTTTVTFSTSKYQESFDVEDGKAGAPGQNGISPQATVTKTGNITTIKITDLNGVTMATVNDGAPGQPGADGVSPNVTATDITGGHRVKITDADGMHSFDVMDGAKGDPLTIIGTARSWGVTDTPDTMPGSWSSTIPTVEHGKYLWSRTRFEFSDGTVAYTTNCAYQGVDGAKGDPGDDYTLTAADKQEIAGMVLDDLPTWTGGAY